MMLKGIPQGGLCGGAAPKTGCSDFSAPMVATSLGESGSTGSLSTRVFQTLSGGKAGQPATVGPGCAAQAVAAAARASAKERENLVIDVMREPRGGAPGARRTAILACGPARPVRYRFHAL